jgi:hypothetical protein
MSVLMCSVASYLVNAIWQIPLIALAGWGICRLQKRFGPPSQHAIWVVALGFAIFTPALPLWRALVIFLRSVEALRLQWYLFTVVFLVEEVLPSCLQRSF